MQRRATAQCSIDRPEDRDAIQGSAVVAPHLPLHPARVRDDVLCGGAGFDPAPFA